MKKHANYATYAIIASVATLIATALSSKGSACWFWLYQPEMPKCLNK